MVTCHPGGIATKCQLSGPSLASAVTLAGVSVRHCQSVGVCSCRAAAETARRAATSVHASVVFIQNYYTRLRDSFSGADHRDRLALGDGRRRDDVEHFAVERCDDLLDRLAME